MQSRQTQCSTNNLSSGYEGRTILLPDQPRLDLPLELHQEIIESVGAEASILAESKYDVHKEGLEVLCTISLVCKAWHVLAMRHIFRWVCLTDKWPQNVTRGYNGPTGRLQSFLSLIQANPDIGRSVQSVTFDCSTLQPKTHALMEQICAVITPITSLLIDLPHTFPVIRLQDYPRLLSAIHALARTPKLQELAFASMGVYTSLLEGIPNLRCIELKEACKQLVVDSSPPYLARPTKAVLGNNHWRLISMLHQEPDGRAILSDLEELAMTVPLPTEFRWCEVLHLGRLTSLHLRCMMRWREGGAYSV